MGEQAYYYRCGISKMLSVSHKSLQNLCRTQPVRIYKCQKVKSICHLDKSEESNSDFLNSIFPEPYPVHLALTKTCLFTWIPQVEDRRIVIDSKFSMFHLAKITQRKSYNDLITFYFKINIFEDYKKGEESNFINSLNIPPVCSMLDRKYDSSWFKEVSVVFKFETQDQSSACIKTVTSLYSNLKEDNKKEWELR